MKHRHVYRTELSAGQLPPAQRLRLPGQDRVIHGGRRYSYRQLEER